MQHIVTVARNLLLANPVYISILQIRQLFMVDFQDFRSAFGLYIIIFFAYIPSTNEFINKQAHKMVRPTARDENFLYI